MASRSGAARHAAHNRSAVAIVLPAAMGVGTSAKGSLGQWVKKQGQANRARPKDSRPRRVRYGLSRCERGSRGGSVLLLSVPGPGSVRAAGCGHRRGDPPSRSRPGLHGCLVGHRDRRRVVLARLRSGVGRDRRRSVAVRGSGRFRRRAPEARDGAASAALPRDRGRCGSRRQGAPCRAASRWIRSRGGGADGPPVPGRARTEGLVMGPTEPGPAKGRLQPLTTKCVTYAPAPGASNSAGTPRPPGSCGSQPGSCRSQPGWWP